MIIIYRVTWIIVLDISGGTSGPCKTKREAKIEAIRDCDSKRTF